MAKLQLVIGNKNYSSWSMRPWIALRQAGIAFEEILLKFDESSGSLRVAGIEPFSPSRKVPVLLIDGEPVWDSLAIIETLAEMFPEHALWPADPRARRVARASCAEMHSGFQALRKAMPMNIRDRHPGKGMNPSDSTVEQDIARICAIWRHCSAHYGSGGPLLFGRFTAADAFFAPVVMRFRCYAPPLAADAQAYCDQVGALAAVEDWCEAARRETEFVAGDEPYAARP